MISTVDDLAGAVVYASEDVSVGVGELNIFFAALELCAELVESLIDAAEGSDAASNRTAVVGVAVGAVSLILDIDDVVSVLTVCRDYCLSGLDVARLEIGVAGSGNIVCVVGVFLKNVVDDGEATLRSPPKPPSPVILPLLPRAMVCLPAGAGLVALRALT